MSEHQEQVAFFDWVRLNENRYPELRWIFAIPNGGLRDKRVAAKLKREGVRAGVWDVFVPVIRRSEDVYGCYHIESCGLFIEFKYGKNKLTENQKAFKWACLEDYDFEVVYSSEEAIQAVKRYLRIT